MKRGIFLIALLSIMLMGCSIADKSITDKAKDEININATTKVEKEDLKNIDYEKVNYLRIKELKDSGSKGWVWKQKIVDKKKILRRLLNI